MVREFLEQSLYPLWVRGEIGNLTIHRSGHVYFTVKDARSQMSVVFFRGAQQARRLGLEVGLEVEVRGRLTLYEPRGQFQMIADQVRPGGLGALQARFEELKKRLQAEGLFDPDRKRPIPALPGCVGVVTSPQGAAIRDFLQILRRRFGPMHVRIYPAAVQGDGAAREIAQGIEYLNAAKACDVIVVTRGGGSIEDLWAFNEEVVARAIAASVIPVISAVGHEVDTTIADYAADLRVPTPSAAAELVTERRAELEKRIVEARRRLAGTVETQAEQLRLRLERVVGSYVFQEPQNAVRTYQQRLDELLMRFSHTLETGERRLRSRLEQLAGRLHALNPRAVLGRGYAVLISKRTGRALLDAADAVPGDAVRGILHRGELDTVVRVVIPGAPDTGDDAAPTTARKRSGHAFNPSPDSNRGMEP
ncbi:MAG: exodeoxyribonuclease VII large subunit [Kiritimatiellaeota bacterium]|nr:exodeoxyribonuclease VII large subunit [Kiritimatiellota bacterium]